MPAVVFKAKSLTELLDIRAREQGDQPYIYTGSPDDAGVTLQSLTYVHLLEIILFVY